MKGRRRSASQRETATGVRRGGVPLTAAPVPTVEGRTVWLVVAAVQHVSLILGQVGLSHGHANLIKPLENEVDPDACYAARVQDARRDEQDNHPGDELLAVAELMIVH